MRSIAIRVVLGLSIIAGSITLAKPASASTRWRDFVAGPNGVALFFGVSGCCTCLPRIGCRVVSGTKIIAWENDINDGKNHNDQLWDQTTGSGVNTTVKNFMLTTNNDFACLGISGNATQKITNGTQAEVRTCDGGMDQVWEIRPSTDSTLQAPFRNSDGTSPCFIFRNTNSGQVLGIANATAPNAVKDGAAIIQWPLFLGTPNSFAGWHADQFWCPQ